MKINALIASAVVLGSSSAAMADVSFQARASWNTTLHTRPASVRDHRYENTRPVYRPSYERPRPMPLPVVTNLNCSNWDPMVDFNSQCASVYHTLPSYGGEVAQPWGMMLLGTRDSSVVHPYNAKHQFITVQRAFRTIEIQPVSGRPEITRVQIRFVDGTTQVVNMSPYDCHDGASIAVASRLPINQILFYTTTNSRGAYSIFAR
jgi:hypothetical protein